MNPEQEFENLFTQYFNPVYAYFSLCFPDGREAEDCAQKVFENVWRSLSSPGAKPPENGKAWVFRLAVNVKNDRLRQKYAAPQTEPFPETDEKGSEPDHAQKMAVEGAFNRLSLEEREILLLKNNGFTSTEAGGILKISASAARSRLAAAKKAFGENLAKNGVDMHG